MAKAAANFIAVEPADVLSAHVGGAEGALAAIFATAVAAEPCVVFFDEVQALFAGRSASGATGKLSSCLSRVCVVVVI